VRRCTTDRLCSGSVDPDVYVTDLISSSAAGVQA